MKFIMFTRETNKFEDITKDPALKKKYRTKIEFTHNLILGFAEDETFDKLLSYIVLKYGEDIMDFYGIVTDRTPIPNVDYTPIRKK